MGVNRFRGILATGFLAVAFCLFSSPNNVVANEPVESEMAAIGQLNQASLQVVRAQIALEEFNLARLRQLHDQEHATWVELARQEVKVEALRARHDSLAEYSQYADAVFRQTREMSTDHDDSGIPIKIHAAGSHRLIGWIEPRDQRDLTDADWTMTVEARPDEISQALRQANDRLDRAARRYADFAGDDDAANHWAVQAKLLRDLAAAEVAELRLRRKQDFRNSSPEWQAGSLPHVPACDVLVQCHSSDPLLQATLAVVRADATATGKLRIAELELQQLQLKSELVRQLQDQGFATQNQVDAIQVRMDEAIRQLDNERGRLAVCQTVLDSLGQPVGYFPEPAIPGIRPALTNPADVPKFMLSHRHRALHLVDLHRKYQELDAQLHADRSNLQMQEELLQRLVAAPDVSVPATGGTLPEAELVRLTKSLNLGTQRQIASRQMKIQVLQARIQDAAEQQNILSLEESRFVAQCRHQDRHGQIGPVDNLFTFQGVGANPQPGRLASYVECLTADHLYGDLVYQQRTGIDCFALGSSYRPASPVSATIAGPASLTASSPGFLAANRRPWVNNRALLPSRVDPYLPDFRPVPLHGWYVNEPGFILGTWSTRDIYPHGILRQDLRDRIPPGFPPWYLPGIPTNLQR